MIYDSVIFPHVLCESHLAKVILGCVEIANDAPDVHELCIRRAF